MSSHGESLTHEDLQKAEIERLRAALAEVHLTINALYTERDKARAALAEAREVIKRAEKALSRVTTDVFNDNGNITWGLPSLSQADIELAYWTERRITRWLENNP